MNKDQVTGKLDQMSGKVKEKVGEAVGNQHLANQGVADQVKGAAKETYGNAKEAVHDNVKAQRHEAEQHATETRERIVKKTQDLKDRANETIDQHRKPA